MTGLDGLGTHERVGFDFMSLLKGAAAMASGAGDKDKAKAEADKKAEEERARAAKSARTRTILMAVGAVAGVGGIAALLLRRRG